MRLVYICRDMDDMILGVFDDKANAEQSFKNVVPKCEFSGVVVMAGARQIGWMTEHVVDSEARGDFKSYSKALG